VLCASSRQLHGQASMSGTQNQRKFSSRSTSQKRKRSAIEISMKFIKQKAEASGSAEQRKEITDIISSTSTERGFPEHAKLSRHSSSIHESKSMPILFRSHENVIKFNEAEITKRGVCKSLAISNALELLKVFFLSSSSGSEVQATLTATFQLYSEREILTAVSFLREKNFLVSTLNLFINISSLICLFLHSHTTSDVLICSSPLVGTCTSKTNILTISC
jgi:hypothetical protein